MKQLSSLLKISVSALFFYLFLTASSDELYRPSAGAGEAGMGYVCIMNNRFWSSFHNQALLAFNNSFSIGFSYENRFSIMELGTSTAGITIPVGKASIGGIYSLFGYSGFKREMTGIACGMKISEIISAGVQVDYFLEKSPSEYPNIQSITFETGLLVNPSENIRIGIHLFNPVPNSLRKSFMPASLRIGAGVDLNKLLFMGMEAEMITGSKLIIRTGFEYGTKTNIVIRGGFCTKNSSFCFGLGYLVKAVMIDLGFTTHEILGVTSSASIIFKIH